MSGDDSDEEDSSWPSESESKDERDDGLSGTLLGLGFAGIGAGVYALLGGDGESLTGYPLWVDFNEPADAGEKQVPTGVRVEDRCHEETQCRPRL